jgi:hypothetical protein
VDLKITGGWGREIGITWVRTGASGGLLWVKPRAFESYVSGRYLGCSSVHSSGRILLFTVGSSHNTILLMQNSTFLLHEISHKTNLNVILPSSSWSLSINSLLWEVSPPKFCVNLTVSTTSTIRLKFQAHHNPLEFITLKIWSDVNRTWTVYSLHFCQM